MGSSAYWEAPYTPGAWKGGRETEGEESPKVGSDGIRPGDEGTAHAECFGTTGPTWMASAVSAVVRWMSDFSIRLARCLEVHLSFEHGAQSFPQHPTVLSHNQTIGFHHAATRVRGVIRVNGPIIHAPPWAHTAFPDRRWMEAASPGPKDVHNQPKAEKGRQEVAAQSQ